MGAVTINEASGPITVEDRVVRDPGPGEVRLRVIAAAVNPADIVMWRTLGGGALKPPVTPGMDAAGTVEAIGDGVDRLAVGDSVIAVVNPRLPEGGAQAELIIVPAASVVRAPPGVDPAEASTLPMTGLTGLEGLPCSTLPPENVGAPFWLRDDFVVVVEAGQELRLGVRCRRSFNDGLRSERRLLRAAY